jgi:CHRD domain
MKRLSIVTAVLLAFAAPTVSGTDSSNRIRIKMTGYEEVPSVSTLATGTFSARIARDEQSIAYRLSWRGLQAPVTQAHVHFAQRSVNGGIVLWMCGTATNPGPAGTQVCPTPAMPGDTVEVSGTWTAANVQATAATQQIAAGELAEVIAAIRAGAAYANVHTTVSPGGEIRGQLEAQRGHGHDDDDDD